MGPLREILFFAVVLLLVVGLHGYVGWRPIDDPLAVERLDSGVILELKFANRAPMWMVDLVQRFGLQLRGFSKYSTSIEQTLGAYRGLLDVRVPRRLVA